MPVFLSFLSSKAGISAILGALILGAFGVEHLELLTARKGEKDAKATLQAEQQAHATCQASLGTLKASNLSLANQSARALSEAQKQTQAVSARADHYAAQAKSLKAPQGVAELDRWHDADEQVRGALK